MTCQRCGTETMSHTMSMFSEALICMDCKTKERAHPKYKEAQEAERQAVMGGNRNFKGIGYPHPG